MHRHCSRLSSQLANARWYWVCRTWRMSWGSMCPVLWNSKLTIVYVWYRARCLHAVRWWFFTIRRRWLKYWIIIRCCRRNLNSTCFPIMDTRGKPDRLPDGTPCYQGFCNMVIGLLLWNIINILLIYETSRFALGTLRENHARCGGKDLGFHWRL